MYFVVLSYLYKEPQKKYLSLQDYPHYYNMITSCFQKGIIMNSQLVYT